MRVEVFNIVGPFENAVKTTLGRLLRLGSLPLTKEERKNLGRRLRAGEIVELPGWKQAVRKAK